MITSIAHSPRFLHQTDLFRPHNDPDDHWDLACAFALAACGRAELAGILIDHPPTAPVLNHYSEPDHGAVAQLAHLTGVQPQVAIGQPDLFSTRHARNGHVPDGVGMVLEQLAQAPDGLFIIVVGAARDLADAITRQPGLFREKCRGIYVNIGSGNPNPDEVKALEWNLKVDPLAFASILNAPCPIFWMPCLEDEAGAGDAFPREFATHYLFRQQDILERLPRPMRNYFGWMFSRDDDMHWAEALEGDFEDVLASKSAAFRMMYSTGSFFDLMGLGVTRGGQLRARDEDRDDWVYRFEPIDVTCSEEGITRWRPSASPQCERFIFRVTDRENYPAAMTRAMGDLLVAAFSTPNRPARTPSLQESPQT